MIVNCTSNIEFLKNKECDLEAFRSKSACTENICNTACQIKS